MVPLIFLQPRRPEEKSPGLLHLYNKSLKGLTLRDHSMSQFRQLCFNSSLDVFP
jgi:hypothetical protein